MDSTVKTLYGHQEGGGRLQSGQARASLACLSHRHAVEPAPGAAGRCLPGDRYNVAHATDGLWTLLDHLGPTRRPALLRGDKSWGIERVMARAEQSDLVYLFRLRMTANVRRSLERAMQHADWGDAAKAGRARKPACGWRAGAASGGSFCCAVNWPAMWRSPIRPTPPNRGSALPRSGRTRAFGSMPLWSLRWTARS